MEKGVERVGKGSDKNLDGRRFSALQEVSFYAGGWHYDNGLEAVVLHSSGVARGQAWAANRAG